MDLNDKTITETQRQAEILSKMKALRVEEPVEPTEALEADTEVQEVTQEVEAVAETEQVEPEQTEDSLYYEIEGKEISLSEILGWRDGNLRQSDYTRKTQEVADQRKGLEGQLADLTARGTTLDDLALELEAMITANESKVDWEVDGDGFPLYDADMHKYQKHQITQDSRKKVVQDAKTRRQQQKDTDLQSLLVKENQLLADKLPTWNDTKQREADIQVMDKYLEATGRSQADIALITDHRNYIDILNAAKWLALQKPEAKATIKNAPRLIKPTASKAKPSDRTNFDEARTKLAQSGSRDDAVAALKQLRQRG